jgi:hypothetical protein
MPTKKAIGLSAALATLIPAPVQAQDEHPRSYYPTLTRADIAGCKTQFAALQADVVEHFRQSAYRYRAGGDRPDEGNVRVYTQKKNEIAAKDPVTFYIDGLIWSGEGVGDLDGTNKYWNEELAQRALDWVPDPDPPSALEYGLARAQVEAPAEKCVAKVWFKKFNAMHASSNSTKANPAVWALNESLSPLSISGAAAAPPGKDAHIIAGDGKSAMTCVKLVRVASGDSKMSRVGGRVLANQCADAVEIGWCYSPGDCDTETGSSWTVRPGHSWPVKSAGMIRWAACHGANTQSFVKGSHGLRYYCSAPK